jgi:DNA helicase-2/ATP-dependent DNA helicase PcrA
MVVGDDDQSIYRFRGAELENMLNFTELYANTRYYSLTNNYRSTQRIVDLAYTLIQHNNPARLEIKTGLSKRLKAQIRGTLPEVQQYADNQEEFQALAKNIQRSAARGDSVAVLCRNNGHVDELIQYLQHLGIPVASQANKNLLHAPVVRQCIDFVRVLHDPDDSAALYRYLVSPKLKVPTTNVMTLAALARKNRVCLKEVIEDNRLTAQKESNALLALDGYRKIAHDHTIGEVLYRFVTDDDYLDDLARKAQDDNQAAHSVRQLAAFFNLVKEFEAVEKHRDSLHFWSYLQDMYSTDILEEIDLIEESEGVHVMTAHRAKGLEFDVVYLYDMTEGNFPATKRAEQLKSPKDFNLTTKDIDLQHESEERRLMYVAMTRAKKHLVMTLSLDHGGKKIRKLSRFLLEAFDKNLKIDGYLEKSGLPAAIMRHRPTMSQPGEKPTFPIDSDGFMVMSPSQVANYLYNPSSFFVQHVLGFPNPPSHQAVYGVSIHASLEYFYRQKLAGRTPKLKEMLNIFNDTWRSEGFISLRHEQERRREGELSIANYHAAHIKDCEEIVAVEQEFNFQIDELKLRLYGRYDLVVKNTDSKISIRDFKTSYVSDPKTAQNKVRDNIALGIYALAWDRENDEKVSTIELYFTEAQLLASRDKIEHQKTMDKLSKVVEGIRSGHFPHKGNQTNLEEEGLA